MANSGGVPQYGVLEPYQAASLCKDLLPVKPNACNACFNPAESQAKKKKHKKNELT